MPEMILGLDPDKAAASIRDINISQLRNVILVAMNDLQHHATDTVWLTPFETVFERLAQIYQEAGGSREFLQQMYPEYFDGEVE
jgi:hypothetical protein